MPDLGAFIDRWAGSRFEWGVADCCLGFVSAWVVEVSGRDPAHAVRGRYATARGAKRLIARAGGLEALYAELAAQVGWSERPAPCPGDVGLVLGVVDGPGKAKVRGLVGAICTGPRWAMFTPAGVVCLAAIPAAVWGP